MSLAGAPEKRTGVRGAIEDGEGHIAPNPVRRVGIPLGPSIRWDGDMSETPNIPAAWYDDPTDPARLRYWDGTAWTENYAPKPGAPTAAPAPAYGAA